MFLTDRNDEGGSDWQTRFGSRLLSNWKLTCGRALFRDAPTREVGKEFNKQLISIRPEDTATGSDDCYGVILNRLRLLKHKNVLVYLHGYYNTFGDALSRARAFAEDIQFSGLVLVWSWPSAGQRFGYEDDEKAVSWSTDHFIDFITGLMSPENKFDIDFVAHSMGNRMLVDLAAKLKNEGRGSGRALVFAAPDVADDEFSQKITPMHFQTLYASRDDRAMKIARYLHKHGRRAGGADDADILIVTGVESIEAILRGHSYVYEDPRALRDVGRLLRTQERASTRGLTERQRSGGAKYWVINP